MSANLYFDLAVDLIRRVQQEESENIRKAARLITDSIRAGGMVHVFGAGHSHLLSEEMYFRAGGLVPLNPILDLNFMMNVPASKGSQLERLPNYGKIVFEAYDTKPGEVIIIASQSGKNAAPVDVAMTAKERGLKVVALTSMEHSGSAVSGHQSGKKVYELADVVLDNKVPTGDAGVELSPELPKVGPLSTTVGAAILNALIAEVAQQILDAGEELPIWMSGNVPGNEIHNQRMASRYDLRLKPI
jgi:uncharacterized phosphosugar-binding protein